MNDAAFDPAALPSASPYGLPTEATPARVSWPLDASRAALLIHDMQAYFLRVFPGRSGPVPELVANIRRLRDRCDERGIPVFYTAQRPHAHAPDRGLQADFWGPGMSDRDEDRAIVTELAPRPGHEVLRKWRYSAFQRAPLQEMLATRGRDQLIVTGVYANIGCLLTAADAFMRDIQPFMPVDAVADFTLDRHLAATRWVGDHLGRTPTVEQALEEL